MSLTKKYDDFATVHKLIFLQVDEGLFFIQGAR